MNRCNEFIIEKSPEKRYTIWDSLSEKLRREVEEYR